MLSERIFFIIERIPDILNVDKERNEILRLCKELSDDDRKAIWELCSDDKRRNILKRYSVDTIRSILENYSDDKTKEWLKWYLIDPVELFRMPQWYWDDEEEAFLELYLPDGEELELLIMHWELSGDDSREEILDNYDSKWRWKLQKYLELGQRWFQEHYVGTFFEIINFLMATVKGKQIVLSNDVKTGIDNLQNGLLGIYNHLSDAEAKYNDRQVLSEYERQFYINLSNIANSCDAILDGVMSNNVVATDIYDLVTRIQNAYSSLSFQPIYNFNTGGNINLSGGQQIIGSTNIYLSNTRPSMVKHGSRPKSYGHVRNPHLVGFDREIGILLNQLTQADGETRMVGIVGTGGAGKTTLAKHIYHDPEINSHFTSKVWVCISQSWDKTTILNSIWRQASQDPNAPEMGYDQLVYHLSQLLCSKSYLVILDDIWSIGAWYDISAAIPPSSGSKVVVTSRKISIPKLIDLNAIIIQPKQLNDKESDELFRRGAFPPNESIPHDLLPLGMEMLKKCKGLPLAIVALAGLLGIDKRKNSWERIRDRLEDKILRMENDSTQGVVEEILALSFHELPHYLKPCVLYLRLFPEDDEIEAKPLVQMWTAECFIDDKSVGEEYLDEMAQRSIVEVVKRDFEGKCLNFESMI